jgi:hypothetical protein
MFKGKGLKPGAFQLWVRGSQRAHRPTSCTFLLYSRLHSLYSRAASELAGEFGFGSHSRLCIDVRIALTSYIGLHAVAVQVDPFESKLCENQYAYRVRSSLLTLS